ncbi:head-tail joining protein [Meridianimarinicoccus sp. RP-17]|jgi:hypothetical protein|uniref:head-tail joining protein n=1 Tax=Meridianimarinicoccus zhengii TaxID=2056810 RepID=UPI000DAB5156|nr:hypothetical protein [Phycocomes zhengii]
MHPRFDDLSVFLDTGDFAIEARITLRDGSHRDVSAIFDDPFLEAELGEYRLDTSQPRLTCRESDVFDIQRGDIVQVGSRIFDVMTGAQADGTGMATVKLAPRHE